MPPDQGEPPRRNRLRFVRRGRPGSPGVLRSLDGHRAAITACRFGLADDVLVVGDEDGVVTVHDLASGACLRTERFPAEQAWARLGITSCGTGPGGLVAAGLTDGSTHVLDATGVRRIGPPDAAGGAVTSVGFFDDGRRMLACHDRGDLRVWDLGSGRCLLAAHQGGRGTAVRGVGRLLVFGEGDRVVALDLDDPARRAEWTGHDAPVLGLAVLPGLVVTTDRAGVIRTWDPAGGRPVACFVGAAGAPAFDPLTGTLVVPTATGISVRDPRAGDPDRAVRRRRRAVAGRRRRAAVWGALADRYPAFEDRADRAAAETVLDTHCWAARGLGLIATVRADDIVTEVGVLNRAHLITFFDRDGTEHRQERLPGESALIAVAAGADVLASVDDEGTTRAWGPDGEERLFVWPTGAGFAVGAAGWRTPVLAVGDQAGRVRLIDLTARGGVDDGIDAAPCSTAVADPGGRWSATRGTRGDVVVRDASGAPLQRFTSPLTGRFWHNGTGRPRVVAPDGSWLALNDDDGRIRIVDPRGGQRIGVVPGAGGELASAAHATWLAVAELDGRLRLWSPSGEPLRTLAGHGTPVRDTSATADGTRLLAASGDAVLLWDTSSGRSRALPRPGAGAGWDVLVLLDPRGRWAAIADPACGAVVLDPATGRERLRCPPSPPVTAWATDPAGTTLAIGHRDGTVAVHDTGTGARLAVLGTGSGRIASCALSPDGLWLATGDENGSVRVVDVRDGHQVGARTVAGAVAQCLWTPGPQASGQLLIVGFGGLDVLEVELEADADG